MSNGHEEQRSMLRPLRKRYLQRTASWCTGHSAQGGSRYCIDRTWRLKALPTWISAAVNGLRSPRGRAPACTYSQRRHLPTRPSSLRLVGLLVRGMQTGRFVSGQHPTQRLSNSTRVRTVPDPPSPAPPERSEAMHPSRPCLRLLCSHLTLLLSLTLLAGLAGCGPASSDNAPNLGPSASVGGPLLSKQGPSPRNDPFTPVASPVPLALLNGPGAAAGTGTVPGGDSPQAVPVPSSESAHPVDGLVVPSGWPKNSTRQMFASGSGLWRPGRSQRPRERSIRCSWPSKIRTNESGLGRSN
jgi:hypothetical protein